jgi:hypothetical protein
MRKRQPPPGCSSSSRSSGRIIGYRDLAEFVMACHALLAAEKNATVRRHASPLPCDRQPVGIAVKVPRRSKRPRAASFVDELSGFGGILVGCQP